MSTVEAVKPRGGSVRPNRDGSHNTPTIGKLWAGQIFGTNTGKIFAEFENTEIGFSGVLRLLDDRFGIAVYDVNGTFDGVTVEFEGKPKQAAEDVGLTSIRAKASLTPEGNLRGQWESEAGTGGTFVAFPHDTPHQESPAPGALPERLHTATRKLGAIRLYRADVIELIAFLGRDFTAPRVVVTYYERGNEISVHASQFEKYFDRLGELRFLKLWVQEPEAYGLNRNASIELNADGVNEVRTQGVQESWVIGKAESLASRLRLNEKALFTTFRKYGLNINGILFLIALVLLPELPLGRRTVFIVILFAMFVTVMKVHEKAIPNAAIYLSAREPSAVERAWPQIISWMVAATSAFVAAIAYGLLKGELGDALNWLGAAFR
jgi:hypothetical protein